MEESVIRRRIDELLKLHSQGPQQGWVGMGTELFEGAITLMGAVYGLDSPQVNSLQQMWSALGKEPNPRLNLYMQQQLVPATLGALRNLRDEIDAGMLGSLRLRMTADVLTDFVELARVVLDQEGDGAKNVGAVLAAAAFEDVIRRMGVNLASITSRDDLQDVISALKNKGVLESPQVGIAQSYLNFRNRALHAEWERIDRASVSSVLAFVEQLLLKHFG